MEDQNCITNSNRTVRLAMHRRSVILIKVTQIIGSSSTAKFARILTKVLVFFA